MAREGTEDNDIRHRITADTVAAVDPAHHFTGGVGAANRLLRHIQHFAIGINGHAAHGVVHAGGDANGVERALKKYLPNGMEAKGQKCPNCGLETLIYQEGCLICTNCGASKCG